jgi:predicted nucleic acid-binding protein
MVRPLERGTGERVDEFLSAVNVTVVDVSRSVARRAAQLRACQRSLRLGDALSLATALSSGAELLSFDQRLRRIAEHEKRSVERAQAKSTPEHPPRRQ